MPLHNRAEQRRIERGEGRNKPFLVVDSLESAREYAYSMIFSLGICTPMDALDIFIHSQCALWTEMRDEFIDDYI